jgi:hypothetical protein
MVTVYTSCFISKWVFIYIYEFCMFLVIKSDDFLNRVKKLIRVIKCGVLFEVRGEFLNTVWTNFGSKGLS